MRGKQTQTFSFAEFELDAAHRRLVRGGKTLPLNTKAFDLLVYLAENAGRVLTNCLDESKTDGFRRIGENGVEPPGELHRLQSAFIDTA